MPITSKLLTDVLEGLKGQDGFDDPTVEPLLTEVQKAANKCTLLAEYIVENSYHAHTDALRAGTLIIEGIGIGYICGIRASQAPTEPSTEDEMPTQYFSTEN